MLKEAYLLLTNPIDFISVAYLGLKLCKALSHNDLVFLGKARDTDLLHAFDYVRVYARSLIRFHFLHQAADQALVLGRAYRIFFLSLNHELLLSICKVRGCRRNIVDLALTGLQTFLSLCELGIGVKRVTNNVAVLENFRFGRLRFQLCV